MIANGSKTVERSQHRDARVEVSVVVPVDQRPEHLGELYEEFSKPLRDRGFAFEFLFATEPWYSDRTGEVAELAHRGEPVRVLEVAHPVGETGLLKLAAGECRGNVVVTLPAYRRVRAAGVLTLIDRVRDGADLAVARRWPRGDSWINRLQNRAFHALLRWLLGSRVKDVACGVRAMRRKVLIETPLYGDFVRFFPLLALREGFRVVEVPVAQHEKDAGRRVYSPGIYLRRLLDVLAVFFLLRFTEKPLRFFGLIGATASLVGGALASVLLVQRLAGQGLADRPLLLLALLLIVLGVQAIALGLIGEIVVHLHAPDARPYRLARPESAADADGGPRLLESPPPVPASAGPRSTD